MKKAAILKLTVFILLIFCWSIAAAADNSITRIDKAFQDGELDYQTALNYKLYALFNQNKLPAAYRSEALLKSAGEETAASAVERHVKSATPLVFEARQNSDLLFKDNRFILNRPTDPDDIYGDYYGDGVVIWTYNSAGGHFTIHYTEDTSDDDAVDGSDGKSSIPPYVQELAGYLENAWTQVIDTLGYTAPPNSPLDVYLVDMNAYGYTAFDTSPADVYMVIENDFNGFPDNLDPLGTQTGAQKVTAAHEFFHTSQFQYTTNQTNLWWMEASAVWMEDQVYPEVKDYLNYLGRKYDDTNDNGSWDIGEIYYQIDGVTAAGTLARPSGWFDHPDYALDSTTGSHPYGSVIWAKYLSETYGHTVIKNIWDWIGSGAVVLTALSNELTNQGTTLSQAFVSFQTANYTRNYIDGDYYPIIKHAATTASYPQDYSGALAHLSSYFVAFKATDSTSFLTLTFTDMNSGNLAVRLFLNKVSGGYDEQDVSLDSSSVSTQIDSFGSSLTYSKAVAVIMNTSSSQNGEVFSVSASTEAVSDPGDGGSVSSGGDGDGGGGGCFIATANPGLQPYVKILQAFGDRFPKVACIGRKLVYLYYGPSPQSPLLSASTPTCQ